MSCPIPPDRPPGRRNACIPEVGRPRHPHAFLVARAGVSLLLILLVAARGHWELGHFDLPVCMALLGWLASSSAAGVLGGRHPRLRKKSAGLYPCGDPSRSTALPGSSTSRRLWASLSLATTTSSAR